MRSIIVHGGAWQIPDDEVAAHLSGIRAAVEKGMALLRSGAPALDVVVETIALLEDDPTFDAGRGSVLNQDGAIEMDASVMDGSTMRAGACVCVTDVANPVRLARAILDDGRAVMLAGDGASRFARSVGIPACRREDLLVPRETARKEFLERLESYKTRQPFDGSLGAPRMDWPADGPTGTPTPPLPPIDRPLGTVGAVCCDARGRLAAATSTGGAPYTLPGRVGDSPILGAGTWAENGVGAASATGWGEAILRDLLAFRAVQEIDTVTIEWRRPRGARRGTRMDTASRETPADAPLGSGLPVDAPPRTPDRPADVPSIAPGPVTYGPIPRGVGDAAAARAARLAIRAFERRVYGVGGVILIAPDGDPGFAFNTPRMARGFWIEGMGVPTVECDPA